MTPSPPTIGGPLHILIVDDDEGDRREVRRHLQRSGLNAVYSETTDIAGALEQCEKTEVDCVIVDYNLPGENGLVGVSALRSQSDYLAIIMLTGQGDETIAMEAVKRGATDYLPKAHYNSLRHILDNAMEKVRLQKKLDEQYDALELFSAVLAHDLMAPTRSIQGFARLIQRAMAEGNMEKVATNCDHLIRAAQRMDLLIKTLRSYTLAEDDVPFEAVDLGALMQEVLQNLEAEIIQAKAIVTCEPLPTVAGNGPQLIQLLQNLIGNGIKFNFSGAPIIKVGASRQGVFWLVTVADNGVGIPIRDKERIFIPFNRLDGTQAIEGTGLGLATCRKIVERHGGRIWLAPPPETGTRIQFTLQQAN